MDEPAGTLINLELAASAFDTAVIRNAAAIVATHKKVS
jgi:hypothetical protein